MSNTYHIRFNKSRGQPGRGTRDHVWRVFENGREYIFKHVNITVPVHDAVTGDGYGNDYWNFCCTGVLTIDKETSTAHIAAE
jgi:hypothetical protein